MKKLLFFSVALGLALSINAQTESSILKSTPIQIQNPSVEKMERTFLAPKDANILQKTNVDKPKHKANYAYYGQISNGEYMSINIPGYPSYGAGDYVTLSELFPDSFAAHYFLDLADSSSRKNLAFSSAGFVFDPYSLDYDRYQSKGLFRDSLGVGVGYRLDTISTYVDYHISSGYDPNNPDTLLFYISYYDAYNNGTNKNFLHFVSDDGKPSVLPIIGYPEPLPPTGAVTIPNSANTIMVPYPLSAKDSVITEPGRVRIKDISLPIPGGYNVPAGSCLSVVVKYLPNYNYNLGDTLSFTTTNSSRPSGQQTLSKDIPHNYIAIPNWDYDTAISMEDRTGCNIFLHETQGLRYKDTSEWGHYYNSENGYECFIYDVRYYGKPMFFMSLSVDTDDGDTVHFSNWREPGAVKQIENLVSNIYPNPATTQLTVDLNNAGNANMSIYNMLGQVVMEATLTEMSNKINITDLSQGMYVVKVIQNGKTHTVKLSKK
jgi:hypothetical protein